MSQLIYVLNGPNLHQREAIYHNSLVSKTATAVMAGLGAAGYGVAVDTMALLLATRQDGKPS
jgi:3-dehydroquinate dehydratase II